MFNILDLYLLKKLHETFNFIFPHANVDSTDERYNTYCHIDIKKGMKR